MLIRDPFGTVVNEGEFASYALSSGVVLPVKLEKVQTLIPNQPPLAFFSMQLVVPVDQNGVIGGITAIKQPETKKILEA